MVTNHSGHRDRMRREFFAAGLDGFSDCRALELLLCYSRPRGDVNPLAHALLDRFGSLAGVLDATPQQLCTVPGMGESSAVLLKLVPALAGRYQKLRSDPSDLIRSTRDLRNLLLPYFFGARNEMVYLVCLDAKHKVLGVRKLGEGSVTAAEITGRRVVEAALSHNASAAVLAHNHATGIATPSQEDLSTTRYLKDLLAGWGSPSTTT